MLKVENDDLLIDLFKNSEPTHKLCDRAYDTKVKLCSRSKNLSTIEAVIQYIIFKICSRAVPINKKIFDFRFVSRNSQFNSRQKDFKTADL